MMAPMRYLEKIGQEIRDLSRQYYQQGFEDYHQRTLNDISSKYVAEVLYRNFSGAVLLFWDGRAYIQCEFLTGGWLFRVDRGGDVELDIKFGVKPSKIDELRERYDEKQMTPFFPAMFQCVRDAERKLMQRTPEFKKWYKDIINEFACHLFEEQPDIDALREIMGRMKEGVAPDMDEAQAAAVLLKAVVEEHRLRCHASVEDTDPIWLVSDVQFLVSTEFMEDEKRIAYFTDCYNQLLHAASLFFFEGASYAQWKSVVNQVFEVGCGRKVEDVEYEVDIIMRRLCGFCVPVGEEQIALDLLHSLLQTLEEIRQGKHKEDIEKVKARLTKKAEEKKYGRKCREA